MQVVVEKKDGAEVSLKVEVPKEKVNEEFSRAFRRLVKDVEMPGFRKGRVPRAIFERKFGKKIIQEEAIKELYPQIYKEIVKEHKLIPIIDPELQVIQFSEGKPLVLKIDLVTRPETKLGGYKGIKVKSKEIKVCEDEITAVLSQLQLQHAHYVSVGEKREAREGDWLSLDWQAFYKGERLSGERRKNDVFQLGSSALPSSFSQGLIGSKPGSHKELEVQFPSQHPQRDFAGRKITFEVTVRDVKEQMLPPLNDEFAKNLKFDSLKNLKEHIEKSLKRAKEDQEKKRLKEEIVKKVVNNAQIHLPLSLERKKMEERIRKLERDLKKQGYSLQDYLKEKGLSEKGLQERIKSIVEEELKVFFVLEAIAKQENIQVSEEELKERLKFVTGQQKEEEIRKLKERLSEQDRLESIIEQMRMEKVIEFLYNKAEISNHSLLSTD